MKKQIKKLSLMKKTISNLKLSEMNNKIGGTLIFRHAATLEMGRLVLATTLVIIADLVYGSFVKS